MQAGIHPGYVANNWYVPLWSQTPQGSGWLNPTAGRVVCSPGAIAQTMTISNIGAVVGTLGAGNAQYAVYNNGAWGRPSTLVMASPSVSTGAVGGAFASVTQQLTPGNYWWCQNMDNTTAIVATYGIVTSTMQAMVGGPNIGNAISTASASSGIFVAQSFGAWPDFNSGTAWTAAITSIVPAIAFKVGTVP